MNSVGSNCKINKLSVWTEINFECKWKFNKVNNKVRLSIRIETADVQMLVQMKPKLLIRLNNTISKVVNFEI